MRAQQGEESLHNPAVALGARSGMTAIDWSAVPRPLAPEANQASALRLAPNTIVPNNTTVYMSGSTAYQYAINQAKMTVDQVSNTGSVTTGTLRLTLWFSTAVFPASGYETADYTLGTLAPAHTFTSIDSGFVPWTVPPTGCYHVALLLEEFVGAQWVYDDYVAYSNLQSINSPPRSPEAARRRSRGRRRMRHLRRSTTASAPSGRTARRLCRPLPRRPTR